MKCFTNLFWGAGAARSKEIHLPIIHIAKVPGVPAILIDVNKCETVKIKMLVRHDCAGHIAQRVNVLIVQHCRQNNIFARLHQSHKANKKQVNIIGNKQNYSVCVVAGKNVRHVCDIT